MATSKKTVIKNKWIVYNEDDAYPPEAGEYDVICDGTERKAYFYGSGWWGSIYEEDEGEIEVEKWLEGSLTTKKESKKKISPFPGCN